ncbi:MAG: MEKHLA domain-containing protein [Planctomycetales bacterium]|nr:MEKHLA domain-containing protein [Planctomycetales bacterium]
MNDDRINSAHWVQHSQLLLDSFEHFLGRSLIDRCGSQLDQSTRLFRIPAVVVAHGTETDPILSYGNQAAIDLWETDLETLLSMPSRKTAEPEERKEREDMLRRGLEKGFIDDYQGIRVTTTGKRFFIENAIIWTLIDSSTGERMGQAATFAAWRFLES